MKISLNKAIILFFLFFINAFSFHAEATFSHSDPDTKNVHTYPADLAEGLIGYAADRPVDNPGDNVFNVNIDDLPEGDVQIWLSYELYGVQDHNAVSRSINNEMSQGGYLVKESKEWHQQRELLNPSWVKSGINNIRFSVPENAAYHYRIKNLNIEIEQKSDWENVPTEAGRDIIVNQPDNLIYYDNQGYLKGYISGNGAELASLYADGKKINTTSSAFECLVNKPDNANESWEVLIAAMFLDGTTVQKVFSFKKELSPDYINNISDYKTLKKVKWIGHQASTIELKDAKIYFPAGALHSTDLVSITALRNVDLVSLDQGMINVTGSYPGYRFLAQDDKFEKAVEVTLAYDERY